MSFGTNPKDNLGVLKPPLHLVPPALVLWVSGVFGFSSKKYGPYNWRENAVKRSIYIDAIERHLLAMKDGHDIDRESGLPHAAHIGANVAILLDAAELGCLIDDQTWKSGSAPELIDKLTQEPPLLVMERLEIPPDAKIRPGAIIEMQEPRKVGMLNPQRVRVPVHTGCFYALSNQNGTACEKCREWWFVGFWVL